MQELAGKGIPVHIAFYNVGVLEYTACIF